MNISAPFITRPVATTLLTIGLAVAGILGFRLLPVASLPQVDFPTIQVSAQLPGASPETMASSVAAPLERQFGRIAGITEMTSSSSLGATSIVLQFDLDRNIDGAARDVQASINAARTYLPPSLPMNPTYRKVNPADAPVLIIALTSDSKSTGQMYDLASSILQQRLSRVEGVGQVFVGGSSLPAVRVELNPQALSRHNVGLEDVRATIAATNVRRPTGRLVDGDTVRQIDTDDQLRRAEQYRPIIVAWENGSPLRLDDVADVRDSVEDLRAGGMSNGKPAVLVVIFRSPGANVIATVDRVRAALPQLEASLPADVKAAVVLDRTPTIRASLHDVERSLLISVILVTLVVFAFLRSPRAALIPSVAVPVSLIGTFGVMYLFGYSLDNLSLTALTISTGFVVDDAIVVLENITRHIEAGMRPRDAALQGAQEIGFTVLSISVSLVAVFLPILLMGGIIGRLFREFAAVLTTAIVISLVVSLTTTPMMCGALLRHEPDVPERRRGLRERALDGMGTGYRHGLGWVLRHPLIMLIVTLATVALSVKLFVMVPKGFFPQQDTGRIAGGIQAAQDISFQAMSDKLSQVVETISRDPNVESVLGFTGGGGGGGGAINTGRIFATLTSPDKRTLTSDEVLGTAPRAARRDSRRAHVPAVRAGSADRRPTGQRAVPVHAAGRLGGRAGRRRQQGAGEDAQHAAAGRRQHRPAGPRPGGDPGGRPRHRVAPRHLGEAPRRHALRRVRPAPGRHHLHPAEPVPRRDGGGAEILAAPRDPARHLHALRRRDAGAAQRLHALRAAADEPRGEPSGPVPRRDHLLQPRTGSRTQRRGHGDRGRDAGAGTAAERPRQLPGRGAGLPGVAHQRARADPRRPADGLSGARHPLRELHPSRSRSSRRCRRRVSERSWRCCCAGWS